MPRRYWLFKTEPSVFSVNDLAREPRRTASWDGVRSYRARNLLRDEVQVGDGVLVYHSSCPEPAVVGTARVVRAGYPDPTQFDPAEKYHDPRSDPARPRWYAVDIQLQEKLPHPVPLKHLRTHPALQSMALLKKGNRLSIQPVTPAEWRTILSIRGIGVRHKPPE